MGAALLIAAGALALASRVRLPGSRTSDARLDAARPPNASDIAPPPNSSDVNNIHQGSVDDPTASSLALHNRSFTPGRVANHTLTDPSRPPFPHIVMVIIDDLGFNDMGYQSSELERMTPEMNMLAETGVKLEWYYTASTCTPARAALHTGFHWARTGMWWEDVTSDSPWALGVGWPSLAETLRSGGGYATHLVGKWDLGHANRAYWPTARGFDTFIGLFGSQYDNYTRHTVGSVGGAFGGWELRDLASLDVAGGEAYVRARDVDEAYATTLFKERSIGIIANHASMQRAGGAAARGASTPLYLCVAFNAVHAIVSVPGSFQRTAPWRDAAAQTRGDPQVRTALAGALRLVDEAIGGFAEALRTEGLYNDSMLVVVSDNGGMVSHGGSNAPLRGEKATLWEGGHRVPAFLHAPTLLPPHRRNTTYPHLFDATDWAPTLLAGALGGAAGVYACDGVNHWDALAGEGAYSSYAPPRTEFLYDIMYLYKATRTTTIAIDWVQAAIRVGDWKYMSNVQLCARSTPRNLSTPCALSSAQDWLFNLTADPYEQHNVLEEFPSVREQLILRLEAYWNSTLAAPRYLEKDQASYAAFSLNDGFVTEWTGMQHERTEYPKPALANVTFREPTLR